MSIATASTLSAPVNVTQTGATTIIAVTTGLPVVIWKISLTADAATTLTFQDTNGVALSGAFDLATAGSSLTLTYDQLPWFRTPIGTGLQISQTGSAKIQGVIVYTRG